MKTRANVKIARTILPLLHKEIFCQLRATQTNFIKYLNGQGLSIKNKKSISIVDGISYGRTQNCLYNYKISPHIQGYYVLVSSNQPIEGKFNKLNSFLDSKYHKQHLFHNILIEHFISSCKASLSHIEILNGKAKPIFTPVFLDEVTLEKLKSLREGAINFILDYDRLFTKDKSIELDTLYFCNKLKKLFMHPSKEDAINLGSCMVDKYYGSDSSRNYIIEYPKEGGILQTYKFYKFSDWKYGYYKLLPIKYKVLIFPIHFFKLLKYSMPSYLFKFKIKYNKFLKSFLR